MRSIVLRKIRLLLLSAFIVCLVAANGTVLARKAQRPAAMVPWALRDHMTFSVGETSFLYSAENAEWRVEVQNAPPVVDHAGFEIVVEGGDSLTGLALGKGKLERTPFKEESAKGSIFAVNFPPSNGLEVRHAIVSYRTNPFLRILLTVRNTGDAAVEIAAMRPVVMGAGSMTPLSRKMALKEWFVRERGGCAVFAGRGSALFAAFEDTSRPFCFALGVLPQGLAASDICFKPSNATWQGGVTSTFSPPIKLAPGATLTADEVWISYGMSEREQVVPHFARAYAQASGMSAGMPRCWSTVPNDSSAEMLYRAARRWVAAGIRHVLVPGTWEGRPGSLTGATPRYPRNMGVVAKTIRDSNGIPGLTIDPLAAQRGEDDWSALAVDGSRWLNLSTPQGKREGTKRIEKILKWGYRFLVVQPSAIPDKVLRHFKMTRAQADRLAFDLVRATAKNMSVMPTSITTLSADADKWREVAESTSALHAYQATLGPTRFDTNGLAKVHKPLGDALCAAGCPIEFIGMPKRAVYGQLARLMAAPRVKDVQAATNPKDTVMALNAAVHGGKILCTIER